MNNLDKIYSRVEARGQIETLAYYGGAKGQYLLIHPSGRRTVSRTPPPIKGSPTKPPKEEEDVGMAEEEEEGDSESVAINPPPDNASVAEAKPVGLAIAGVSIGPSRTQCCNRCKQK